MLKLKKVTENDVDVVIKCLPEDSSPFDHIDERDIAEKVRDDYFNGNDWAWCCVKVIVTHKQADFVSIQYLGACSYENEEDFKKDTYYQDMVNEAIRDIQYQMEEMFTFLCSKVQCEEN